jgi:hypothetical protein
LGGAGRGIIDVSHDLGVTSHHACHGGDATGHAAPKPGDHNDGAGAAGPAAISSRLMDRRQCCCACPGSVLLITFASMTGDCSA